MSNSITSSVRQAIELMEKFGMESPRNSELEMNDIKMEFEDRRENSSRKQSLS